VDLFDSVADVRPSREVMAESAVLLRGLATPIEAELISALRDIVARAPFRHMVTPGGHSMSVAMTNCGSFGWVTDRTGYRYDANDPESAKPWPAMPPSFCQLARQAAEEAGFASFAPDACLINRYEPGAKMSLHQDKDEEDFGAPIVSVSLGLPAVFLFGGLKRSDKPRRFRLEHGDVVAWGGPSRLAFHGVAPLADGEHAVMGRQRINLTFRKAR
jgi:alkylated DNA repair protein (DNA oxidative demethylase)